LAQGPNVQVRLENAWLHVRDRRESGGCGDVNLAIAEHYLYARYAVAKEGRSGWDRMNVLILGYNVIKGVGLDRLLPETGKCKVSQFSKEDVAWSQVGAGDGLADFLRGSKTANFKLKPPQIPDLL